MKFDKIMIEILKRLKNNIPPSAIQLKISNKELNSALFKLKDNDLVNFDLIEVHPIFKGEPKDIKLTSLGEEVVEKLLYEQRSKRKNQE
ncbi:hypothetical protein Z967_11950 [Clostridium novyi A str. 4540]|uniref:hypothetical protein n=1 Tax=Clostridium novyi TaxID=1542 RepID=UPI0004D3ED10|nr:hypothetical protein [Clostridium novyi]KEH88971.1 hypothetical protein Z967_11950 [Clostridium novyi A str. 4540]